MIVVTGRVLRGPPASTPGVPLTEQARRCAPPPRVGCCGGWVPVFFVALHGFVGLRWLFYTPSNRATV